MSIITTYRLYCTDCGKEYKEAFDEIQDCYTYSKMDGWERIKVENGSIWDFCPKCASIYKKTKNK